MTDPLLTPESAAQILLVVGQWLDSVEVLVALRGGWQQTGASHRATERSVLAGCDVRGECRIIRAGADNRFVLPEAPLL